MKKKHLFFEVDVLNPVIHVLEKVGNGVVVILADGHALDVEGQAT
tara:strand:+ start:373 stop:507 length:135 start_codon:yes stop_codon:yes gene_type:complete